MCWIQESADTFHLNHQDSFIPPHGLQLTANKLPAKWSRYHGNSRVKGPKMTAFDERDDIDSYLHRFERYAELQGWKKTAWAIYLAALLKGKALDVYARLPTEQAQDYDKVKEALLKRYVMTEEGYKQKFNGSKPEVGESPLQFITRIASYFI